MHTSKRNAMWMPSTNIHPHRYYLHYRPVHNNTNEPTMFSLAQLYKTYIVILINCTNTTQHSQAHCFTYTIARSCVHHQVDWPRSEISPRTYVFACVWPRFKLAEHTIATMRDYHAYARWNCLCIKYSHYRSIDSVSLSNCAS